MTLLNAERTSLHEIICSKNHIKQKEVLPVMLGQDTAGAPVIADLSCMPHLLIEDTTEAGQSMAIHAMILSLLYRLSPIECRLIMIDTALGELSVYDNIQHLVTPVITDPQKAILAMKWAMQEAEQRHNAMEGVGVCRIEDYNVRMREAAKNKEHFTRKSRIGFNRESGNPIYREAPIDLFPLTYIVVIVEEMADLISVAGKEVESTVKQLTEMGQAAGIHIILATQQPVSDVVMDAIKNNISAHIVCTPDTKSNSLAIDEKGTEPLFSQCDILYTLNDEQVTRLHGSYVRDDEVETVVKFLKTQGEPEYVYGVTEEESVY